VDGRLARDLGVKLSMSRSTDSDSHDEAAPASPEAVIVALLAQNAELLALVATLQARIAELERQIGLNSGNSGKSPSTDGLKKKPARVSSLRERSDKKSGGQNGHPGKTLSRTETPAATVDHFPATCAGFSAAVNEAMATGHTARQSLPLRRRRYSACPNPSR
jgi:transposase